MKSARIFSLLFMIICAINVIAQSVTVQVASEVEEGRKFQLAINMKNMDAAPPDNVQLPNCTLIYGPAISSSSSYQSINGKVTASSALIATYTFRADKASTITIPSFTVTDSDGKKYTTATSQLKIMPAGQRPSHTRPGYSPSVDMPEGSKVNTEGHFSSDDMFVRIIVDNRAVYEQEPIVATVKLYTHHSIRSFQMLTEPTFEGFLSEELEVNEPVSTEIVNGKEYWTAVLKRCVLYPQKSGKLKLSSGTYEVTLVQRVNVNTNSFFPDFRNVEKQIRTQENVATIDVTPLPQPSPLSFDGAVGRFNADWTLSSETPKTNEPITLNLKITGKGNIKYLKTPELNIPAGIDVYTPKTDINASYSNGDISGTYTVTYTLVPQEVGTFKIPPMQFSYFNPKTRDYSTIDLKGFDLRVAKGTAAGVVEQKEINKGMTDILHIKPIKHNLSKEPVYVYHSFSYWILYIVLTALLITAIFVYRRQLKLNADIRGRQLARALRKAMKRFKKAKSLMANHESEAFYAEINKALWGYLSDKLGIPASQLVRENIATQLKDYGVTEEGITNIISILDECEMARFTPMHSDTDMSHLYDKVVNAVKSIENVKK